MVTLPNDGARAVAGTRRGEHVPLCTRAEVSTCTCLLVSTPTVVACTGLPSNRKSCKGRDDQTELKGPEGKQGLPY